MKLSEVQVGVLYEAMVSGRLQVVRVEELKPIPPATSAVRPAWRTLIMAVNQRTGRRITIRSPQRLRRRVDPGCEFCNLPANRPSGPFTCPYCHKTWTGMGA